MSSIKFSCTSFQDSGKKGILKPDADGYYTMPIGGLNAFNSVGMYYDYQAAKELFEKSNGFMRRVKRGALKGELGHPSQMPGEKDDDFIQRYTNIDEKNTCVHFAEISLDFNNYKNPDGSNMIAIIGKLKGSGPHGEALNASLANPKENVCFSLRALSEDYMVSRVYTRAIKAIIAFDQVTEPGIAIAEKFKATSVEQYTDRTFTDKQIYKALKTSKQTVAQESRAMSVEELFMTLNWTMPSNKGAIYTKW